MFFNIKFYLATALFVFLLLFKYNCLHFHPTTSLAPPIPASHPRNYSLWFCPCVLYICSLMALPLLSPIIPLSLLSGYCQFVLYFNVSGYILLAYKNSHLFLSSCIIFLSIKSERFLINPFIITLTKIYIH